MRILIIEDKKVELEKALEAVKTAGHEAETALRFYNKGEWDRLSTFDAVITDLYFNPTNYGWESFNGYEQNPPPMGLVVAAHCVFKGIPVVICTDSFHHGPEASFIFDSYVSKQYVGPNQSRDIAFGWIEHKSWEHAIKLIEKGLKMEEELRR